jgi:hypothetical protein
MCASRVWRARTIRTTACLVCLCAPRLGGAAAKSEDTAEAARPKYSRIETVIGASCLGAGIVLVLTSRFVEAEYEKVTGYVDRGGDVDPVVTSGGNDTGSLMTAGLACLLLGTMVLVFPADSDTSEPHDAKTVSTNQVGFELQAVTLPGRSGGVGISHGF